MSARSETLAFIDRKRGALRAELEALDAAAAVLGGGGKSTGSGPSVRTRIIEMIEAEDRSWSASQMLDQLAPLGGANPAGYVRTVFTKLVNGGLAVRVAPDTVRAAKFAQADPERMRAM